MMRSYGYVGNVIWQIMKILEASPIRDKKVFYVGDQPIDLYKWVNGFSLLQRGRNVTITPRVIVHGLATETCPIKIHRRRIFCGHAPEP